MAQFSTVQQQSFHGVQSTAQHGTAQHGTADTERGLQACNKWTPLFLLTSMPTTSIGTRCGVSMIRHTRHKTVLQVQELQSSLQQRTTELETATAESRSASEKLHTLRGETAALQQWQQTVQAERAAEAEAVRQAQKVCGFWVQGLYRRAGCCWVYLKALFMIAQQRKLFSPITATGSCNCTGGVEHTQQTYDTAASNPSFTPWYRTHGSLSLGQCTTYHAAQKTVATAACILCSCHI